MTTEDEYLSVQEVAQLLRVHKRSVGRWLDSGELVSFKFGDSRSCTVRIKQTDLNEFLAKKRRGGVPVEREPMVTARRRPRRARASAAA